MPLAPAVIAAIIGGGASVAGGALANRSTQSSAPTMAPEYQGLQDQILQMMKSRLSSTPNLSGYTGQGMSTINAGYDTAAQTQENDLTRRGLASSPVAATVDASRNMARAGDLTRFQNSIPLLQRQLQTEDLGSATNLLGMGRGVTSTATGGGGAAGAFTNLAQYLGYLTGKGAFKGGNGMPGYSSGPGAFGTSGAY